MNKLLSIIFVLGFLFGIWGFYERIQLKSEFARCDRYPYIGEQFEESERFECYIEQIITVTNKLGPKHAVEMIQNHAESDGRDSITIARCHGLGHIIGQAAVRANYSMEDILTQCGPSCAGGCINGAVHTYYFEGNTIKELEKLCKLDTNDPKTVEACYHGIGHAIVEYSLLNLSLAVDQCSKLESEEGRFQCGHGALMDPMIPSSAPNFSLPEDMINLCAQTDKAIRKSCYEFAGFIEYSRSMDIMRAFSVCRQVEGSNQELCQRRIAEAISFKYQNKILDILDICSTGNNEEYYNCALHSIAINENSVSKNQHLSTTSLCERLPDEFFSKCMSEINETKLLFNSESQF